ncbi:hypothetical protein [Acidianus hospitalis]|uniref:hypothetical protein n=1 Tax=Acidianus hospitalis TaxID=563177 RepID=UPI00064FFDDA|nr:hypothetical protein [Acidianus hospitalis]
MELGIISLIKMSKTLFVRESSGLKKEVSALDAIMLNLGNAFDKIGKTIVLNPGSEFSEGILHAAYVVLKDGRVKAHQFIIG